MAAPDLPRKKLKRPHQKSRAGCGTCKRRKVKCDEKKPACSNCIRFGIRCDFEIATAETVEKTSPLPAAPSRRGRGRPRKDWRTLLRRSCTADPSPAASSTPSTARSSTTWPVHSDCSSDGSPKASCDHQSSDCAGCHCHGFDSAPGQGTKQHCAYINANDAELLLHFVTRTAETFAPGAKPDDRILRFWTHNAPQIALSHEYVMHLIYAISASHLAALSRENMIGLWPHRTPEEYKVLAQRHMSAGVEGCTRELTSPGPQAHNCGALYLAAVLICYCTFAAGPDGPDDLLICRVGPDAALVWRPMVQGVHLIRQVCALEHLFSGLMSPLGPASPEEEREPPPSSVLPVCARPESVFPRIEWEAALGRLREFVAEEEGDASWHALDTLMNIYGATYGRDDDGLYDGDPNDQHVFRWLYCIDQDFVACVQRQEPFALLVLAHFALLLETISGGWYIQTWRDHLITTIGRLLPEEYQFWLQWPAEQAGLSL